MKLRRHWLQLLGFATVLAVCAGTLLATAYNRGGVPQSSMTLSERELELPAGQRSATEENTPLTFHLIWRVEPADPSDPVATPATATRAAWITQSKLAQLGIPISRRVGSSRFVSTLLVLEFDGPAHARTVSRACNRASPARDERICELEVNEASRLYVVDAGRSVAELRARYSDPAHFAIVAGVIRISQDQTVGDVEGYVARISVDTVQGVEPLRSALDPATGEMLWHRLEAPNHFDAVIAFGRRLEPWNVSLTWSPGTSRLP